MKHILERERSCLPQHSMGHRGSKSLADSEGKAGGESSAEEEQVLAWAAAGELRRLQRKCDELPGIEGVNLPEVAGPGFIAKTTWLCTMYEKEPRFITAGGNAATVEVYEKDAATGACVKVPEEEAGKGVRKAAKAAGATYCLERNAPAVEMATAGGGRVMVCKLWVYAAAP